MLTKFKEQGQGHVAVSFNIIFKVTHGQWYNHLGWSCKYVFNKYN